jgi:hypothetical protein
MVDQGFGRRLRIIGGTSRKLRGVFGKSRTLRGVFQSRVRIRESTRRVKVPGALHSAT